MTAKFLLIATLATVVVVHSACGRDPRRQNSGPSDRLAKEILEVKQEYDRAQLRNDGAWFQRMFADGYIFVMPDSTVITKDQFIRDLVSRDIVWESVSATDTRVRVYGQTAVVTGHFFGRGAFKGQRINERQFFTSVWIKQDERWQAISEHATSLPKEQ
jgi:hypothetical protein